MSLRWSILKVLAYFDLFNYPVSAEEIWTYLDTETETGALQTELEILMAEKLVFRSGPFFSLQDNQALAERRIRGNHHADELLPIAANRSRLLYQFPFVLGIGISGSLSKHFADEDADIDYFIITRSNRLWIARTLMHLYKKLAYLRGRQHWYCMNYYVDEDALEIKEKNIFTATEMITLLPASGNGGLVRFFDANDWTTDFFPHYRNRVRTADNPSHPLLIKRIIEKILNNTLGDRLDSYLLSLTNRRWKKKEKRGDRNQKGDRMSLQNEKHFSRPNPNNFQQKILTRYQTKIKEYQEKWGMVTSSERLQYNNPQQP